MSNASNANSIDKPRMTFDGKYQRAKDNRGYYIHELFYGIDESNLYYQSGGGGSSQFYQNETKGYSSNTPLQRNMQQHLTKVDCIIKEEEYLNQAVLESFLNGGDSTIKNLWFTIDIKDKHTWEKTHLIREFTWDAERKELTFSWRGPKTVTLEEVQNLYYPHPKIEELNMNKAVELLKRAALIIDENNEAASNRGEYSNINIVSDINRFLENH